MSAQIYRICSDTLVFALRLPTAKDLPGAAELRQRAVGMLDRVVSEGRSLGLPEADLAEARYALVAFIDEQVLKSSWAGRTEWMSNPLQLLLYREYTAGENFFARLRSLLATGARPSAVEIYYLCLALGFRGAYGVSGEVTGIASYSEAALKDLSTKLPSFAKFGPNAQAKNLLGADRRSNAILTSILVGCACLVLLVLIGLHFELRSELGEALASFASPSSSAPDKPLEK